MTASAAAIPVSPGSRGAALLSVTLQWLGAYLLWTFAAGLARRHGLIQAYEPRLFLCLALGAGAVHLYVRARRTRAPARVAFVASQLLWLLVILAQNVVAAADDAPQILSEFGDRLSPEGWELRRGETIEDPIARTVGCFDATKELPADRLTLTYPVKC